jgi:hypothetical protein
MTQGVGNNRCGRCQKVFGGGFGYDVHLQVLPGTDGEMRCLSARELRDRGFTKREDGVWVRRYDPTRPVQTRLFKPGNPVRARTGRSGTRGRGAAERTDTANPATRNDTRGAA